MGRRECARVDMSEFVQKDRIYGEVLWDADRQRPRTMTAVKITEDIKQSRVRLWLEMAADEARRQFPNLPQEKKIMSEPIYLPRPAYEAIARSLGDNIHQGVLDAQEAHRTIAAGWIKDHELTPKQLKYVQAVRAALTPVAASKAVVAPPVEPEPIVPLKPKGKKS